ncbi:MAG: ABC transporter permease [Candidatus Acidiferrales bacterium]
METFLQDIKYGIRVLAKAPGFTAVVVLSLALGIGGNATVFSWAEAALLHPLSGVKNSEQIVALETVMPDGEFHTSSYPDYLDFREQNHVFAGMIGNELVAVNMKLANEEQAQRNWGLIVTENYFDVLGVPAAIGRTFHASDDRGAGSDPFIVLNYGFWKQRFGGDTAVVGQSVELNQHVFTVIGVAPQGFRGAIVGIDANYFVPMMMQPQVLPGESIVLRGPAFVHILGRLKAGVSLEQARAEMNAIAARLAREYPDSSKHVGVYVCPIWDAHYGLQNLLLPVLVLLSAVVIFVLLIACANVANLLLARATVREREIAIRSALGAGRGRLVRQLLVESLLLALAGGAGGVFVALWSSHWLAFFFPPAHLPVGLALGVNGGVLLFTLAITICSGVIFGLAPALAASRANLNASLKEGARRSAAGPVRRRLRDLLVVSEIVLAVVLLVGAGLLVRSLHAAESSSPGFNVDHVLLMAMDLRSNGYSDDQSAAFYERLRARVESLPGVKGVTYERWVPLWFTGHGDTRPTIEGYALRPGEVPNIDYNVVGPGYFSTMQIPILSGREFRAQDGAQSPLVCIVNEIMAQRYWPGENPVGHRLNDWNMWWTVIGVAKDSKYRSMNEQPESFLYFPFSQDTGADANILIRTEGEPAAFLGAVREQVRALDPSAPILESDDLSQLLRVSLFANRVAATLAAVLGLLGLALAMLGIYGVLSYSVSQRTHEIGIRMALGAKPADVLRLVVGHGMRLTTVGLALGLGASLLATQMIASLLYGISASDPLTFVGMALVLAVVAFAACVIPARRAMHVDPLEALRYE